jgi:NO-binding membrane sensor protein with MHYT domain
MKVAFAYAKAAASVLAFVACVAFVLRINETLKDRTSDVERGVLLLLALAGAYFAITKASEYASRQFLPLAERPLSTHCGHSGVSAVCVRVAETST